MKFAPIAAIIVVLALAHGSLAQEPAVAERLNQMFEDMSALFRNPNLQDHAQAVQTVQEQLRSVVTNLESNLKPVADNMQSYMQPLLESFQKQMEGLIQTVKDQAAATEN